MGRKQDGKRNEVSVPLGKEAHEALIDRAEKEGLTKVQMARKILTLALSGKTG